MLFSVKFFLAFYPPYIFEIIYKQSRGEIYLERYINITKSYTSCVGYFFIILHLILNLNTSISYAAFAFATLWGNLYAFNTFRVFVPNAISVDNKSIRVFLFLPSIFHSSNCYLEYWLASP